MERFAFLIWEIKKKVSLEEQSLGTKGERRSQGNRQDYNMGSPLAPVLANIFIGFHESRLFNKYNLNKPKFYFLMTF